MARSRLGVVLLVPQPLATEIDGIRRALGDGARTRIAPHITLVPPVNVHDRDLSDALGIVRDAAAASRPLRLSLGPVMSFAPVNPVAYLHVDGDDGTLAALGALREACLSGPLERRSEHDFVPHVTVADDLPDDRLAAAVTALAPFRADLDVDRVHVLVEQPGRVWRPLADAPLGGGPGTVGRGGLPLDLAITGLLPPDAAALLAVEADPAGRPYAITARRDGVVVGAVWGWTSGPSLDVADLLVANEHRNEGVGRHLLAAVEGVASRRGCAVASAVAPATGAPAALLSGAGWATVTSSAPLTGGLRRWERSLMPAGAA